MGSQKRIVIVESFYNGSHKYWCDRLQQFSKHQIEIISLPGRYWKWRMEAGAIELADQINSLEYQPDLFLVSSLIDLGLLKSLVRFDSKYVLYFHENQLTYPVNDNDTDQIEKRDNHYAFKNYSSALVADQVVFNSEYNRSSFFDELPSFLNQFPKNNSESKIESIKSKSLVLPLGIDSIYFENHSVPKVKNRILWNHRWEFDKGIIDFLDLMISLKNKQVDFELILLGSRPSKLPNEITNRLEILKDQIIKDSFCESKEEYLNWIQSCSIYPVTSKHDFFGLSVLEAIATGIQPILPKSLAYPEHLDSDDVFYSTAQELEEKLVGYLQNKRAFKEYSHQVEKYLWKVVIKEYDQLFQ